jgi:hypothetical protein
VFRTGPRLLRRVTRLPRVRYWRAAQGRGFECAAGNGGYCAVTVAREAWLREGGGSIDGWVMALRRRRRSVERRAATSLRRPKTFENQCGPPQQGRYWAGREKLKRSPQSRLPAIQKVEPPPPLFLFCKESPRRKTPTTLTSSVIFGGSSRRGGKHRESRGAKNGSGGRATAWQPSRPRVFSV